MTGQLTRDQLNFLVAVQSLDDWNCQAFAKVLEDYNFMAPNPETALGAIKFIKSLSNEQVAELQLGLEILASIVGEIV